MLKFDKFRGVEMILYLFTAVVNFLSFLSVTITTSSIASLLAAIFLFSASIGLEAISLWAERKHDKSNLVLLFAIALSAVAILGCMAFFGGNLGFVHFWLNDCVSPTRLMMESPAKSLLPAYSMDATYCIYAMGAIATVIPLLYVVRVVVIKLIRRTYNLTSGFYEK